MLQAVEDGVDILSLSLGPNSPPGGSTSTFLNILDVALLNAVKANILVVQAAGNGGPFAKTVTSFSPWVLSVAAGVDDRTFPNSITLGDKKVLKGTGLARKIIRELVGLFFLNIGDRLCLTVSIFMSVIYVRPCIL